MTDPGLKLLLWKIKEVQSWPPCSRPWGMLIDCLYGCVMDSKGKCGCSGRKFNQRCNGQFVSRAAKAKLIGMALWSSARFSSKVKAGCVREGIQSRKDD